MVLQALRELTELENYLLYLLTDKKTTFVASDIDEFINTVKERLVLFRHPVNQDLYTKFDKFYSEFETVLNYLRDNREWPKQT
jgi:hypothetical protein